MTPGMNRGVSWGLGQRGGLRGRPREGRTKPPARTSFWEPSPAAGPGLTRLRLLLRGRDIYINMYTTTLTSGSSFFSGGVPGWPPPKKSVFSDSPSCPQPPLASASWPPEARPGPSPTSSGPPRAIGATPVSQPSQYPDPLRHRGLARPAGGDLRGAPPRPVERPVRPRRPELRVLRAPGDLRGYQRRERHRDSLRRADFDRGPQRSHLPDRPGDPGGRGQPGILQRPQPGAGIGLERPGGGLHPPQLHRLHRLQVRNPFW